VDYDIVVENNRPYIERFVILKGKKHILDKKEIQ
jgi:hypothetical protein